MFNREAIRAFGALLEEAAARSAETFLTAPITADGIDLEAIGLKRPTATWTYLVRENPFGTDIDRALHSIARRIRKLVVLCRTGGASSRGAGPSRQHKALAACTSTSARRACSLKSSPLAVSLQRS
jgi:hypothetical protein